MADKNEKFNFEYTLCGTKFLIESKPIDTIDATDNSVTINYSDGDKYTVCGEVLVTKVLWITALAAKFFFYVGYNACFDKYKHKIQK